MGNCEVVTYIRVLTVIFDANLKMITRILVDYEFEFYFEILMKVPFNTFNRIVLTLFSIAFENLPKPEGYLQRLCFRNNFKFVAYILTDKILQS